MDFREKLMRLIGDEDQASVARQIGIRPNTLNNYLKRNTRPSADAAVHLAQHFRCDLVWLLNDAWDWEDRDRALSLNRVPSDLLIAEVRDRYIAAAIKFRRALEELQKVDWERARDALVAAPPGVMPRGAGCASHALNHVFFGWDDVLRFGTRADFRAEDLRQTLPDGVSADDLKIPALAEMEEAIFRNTPALREYMVLIGKMLTGEMTSRFSEEAIERRRTHISAVAEERRRRSKR